MISAALWYAVRLCHSVRSCHSPALSLKRSDVARVRLATGKPLGKNLTSGSLPTLPTRMTLLTLFGMMLPLFWVRLKNSRTEPAGLPATRCIRLSPGRPGWVRNLPHKVMGAPGPRFPAKFSGFLALYAPLRIERRTRGPVQHCVQEIRGVSLLRPGIL